MNATTNSRETIEQLNEKVLLQDQHIAELNAKLKWYEEQFRLSKQKQFGSSSEKTDLQQLNLFNEAEDTANPKLEEPTIETITYQRTEKTGWPKGSKT